MLRHLSVRDFVIVDYLELPFTNGFTVLTGETGAGKSILVDALALILGERADAAVIRAGRERTELIAEFDFADLTGLRGWLEQNDLVGDDDACIMRRVIDSGGRSRGFINGRPVTLQQLREAGEWLVDIHGQQAHQSLLRPHVQRDLLDAHAGLQALSAEVAIAWREWQTLHEKRQAWEKNAAASTAEREQLEWQVSELNKLNFSADEWQTINADQARLSHAASLLEAAELGLATLAESDVACLAQVNGVIARLNHLLEYDANLKEIVDILEPAQIQIQEAVYSLRHYQQKLDIDPQQLRQTEQRLEAIHDTARKYRTPPEQLPSLHAQFRARLEELGATADEASLLKQESAAREHYLTLAKKLSAGRKKAAKPLAEKVTAAMQTLAMAGGRFEIVLTDIVDGSAHGLEQVAFNVTAHAGTTTGPLSKVASGGELSRISLAIQVIISEVAAVPTLIFDEVDVGIGGGVAEIVGNMLKGLGKDRQVLCITHLPQVAACGDQQWRVSKEAREGTVLSQIELLDEMQRVEEVARMLGGVAITEKTRAHAAEMLER